MDPRSAVRNDTEAPAPSTRVGPTHVTAGALCASRAPRKSARLRGLAGASRLGHVGMAGAGEQGGRDRGT